MIRRLLERWRVWRERQALLNEPPRLVATLRQRITWTNAGNRTEEITWLMFVDGRGRRSVRTHTS